MLKRYHRLKSSYSKMLVINDLHSYFYLFIRVTFGKSISHMGVRIHYLVGLVCQVLSCGGLPPSFFETAIAGKGWGERSLVFTPT